MSATLRIQRLCVLVAAGLGLSISMPTAAIARVEVAWGDVNGFTIDGTSVLGSGETTLLAQLILAGSGDAAPVDPDEPDGIGGGDTLLAQVDVAIGAQNPNGAFLVNLATTTGPVSPGETIYLRVFAGSSVTDGTRYAQTAPILVEDVTVDRPQAISFTGAPPASGYGAAPRELDLTVVDPTSSPPSAGQVWMTQAMPNLFNPTTTWILHVPAGGAEIAVEVFDARGRHVDTLARGWFAGPEHTLRWRGVDSTGEALASGVYRVQMRSGARTQWCSVVLVR